MSDQPAPAQTRPTPERVQRIFEYVLFNSRWLMAPFYIGLVIALAVLFLKFLRMLGEFILHAPGAKSSETILDALALIDVTLVGNLLLIVILSGAVGIVLELYAYQQLSPTAALAARCIVSALKTMFFSVTVAVSYFELRKLKDGIAVPELAPAFARIRK